MGLLSDRVNNKLEESNLINIHALNREPVPLILTVYCPGVLAMYIVNCGTSTPSSDELAPRNFEKKSFKTINQGSYKKLQPFFKDCSRTFQGPH